MAYFSLFVFLLSVATAQRIGSVPEVHPKLTTQFCTTSSGCVTKNTLLVADSLSHPIHAADNPAADCGTKTLNATLCPDAATCAANCVIDGTDYTGHGVLTAGSALTMRQYVFNGTAQAETSPRLYLLAEDGKNYEPIKLLGQEFTFDVDTSLLGCGMNGALYLVEMDVSGGRSDMNPAGATFGTGYCDAQCFTDKPFLDGVANLNASGACCAEMDIWEANAFATQLAPHTCGTAGSFRCQGTTACGSGAGGSCDKSGCALNPYAKGANSLYGPGGNMSVDTSRPFTVVTQFLTADNTTSSALSAIRRLYVQDGKVVAASRSAPNTVTQAYCDAANAQSDFNMRGGMKSMGEALGRGMVLAVSIWNSQGDFMKWLDQGIKGPCNATAGDPKNIVKNAPGLSVTFSNIKWGDIGSTFKE